MKYNKDFANLYDHTFFVVVDVVVGVSIAIISGETKIPNQKMIIY